MYHSHQGQDHNTRQPRSHAMLVIGGCDITAGAVSVCLQHGGQQGAEGVIAKSWWNCSRCEQ